MKERPILFSAPMVQAILAGQKTQTRRIIKPQPPAGTVSVGILHPTTSPTYTWLQDDALVDNGQRCPYGQPGDRLYVRETWARPTTLDPGPTIYRADYPACVPSYYTNIPPEDEVVWKPSIHMPRSASRITLEIINVRVERLHDISYEDAIAEGMPDASNAQPLPGPRVETLEQFARRTKFPQRSFFVMWDQLHGEGAREADPWLWVVEFRRVQP